MASEFANHRFTIQNVPIKLRESSMFDYLDDEFTIQNVPIKFFKRFS